MHFLSSLTPYRLLGALVGAGLRRVQLSLMQPSLLVPNAGAMPLPPSAFAPPPNASAASGSSSAAGGGSSYGGGAFVHGASFHGEEQGRTQCQTTAHCFQCPVATDRLALCARQVRRYLPCIPSC